MHEGLTKALERLSSVLQDAGENRSVDLIAKILEAEQVTQDQFLVSNELWGGAGSIADQAGLGNGRQEMRRRVEQALIGLAEEQERAGMLNPRTLSWVDAFKKWQRMGI
jgi:hypothetical protein